MPIRTRTILGALVLLSPPCASALGQCGSGIELDNAVLAPHPASSRLGWDVTTNGDYLAVVHGAATDVYHRLASGWVLVQQLPSADSASISGEWLVTARRGVLLAYQLLDQEPTGWHGVACPSGTPLEHG